MGSGIPSFYVASDTVSDAGGSVFCNGWRRLSKCSAHLLHAHEKHSLLDLDAHSKRWLGASPFSLEITGFVRSVLQRLLEQSPRHLPLSSLHYVHHPSGTTCVTLLRLQPGFVSFQARRRTSHRTSPHAFVPNATRAASSMLALNPAQMV